MLQFYYRQSRKHNNNLDEMSVPQKIFRPLFTTRFWSNVPPGSSGTTTLSKNKTQVPPIPGRKRHRINSKRRETRKHQPNVKKVTRILQNQPYSNTKYVDFQLKCREDTLATSFLVQSRHEQRKKSDKEESHKRLLPISNTSHPILPQQQPQVGSKNRYIQNKGR